MKKYSMYTFAVAMLAGMILTGCSSSEEIPGGTPDNGPKLKIETRRGCLCTPGDSGVGG